MWAAMVSNYCLLDFIILLTNSVISFDNCGILGYKVLRNFVIFGDTCGTLGCKKVHDKVLTNFVIFCDNCRALGY